MCEKVNILSHYYQKSTEQALLQKLKGELIYIAKLEMKPPEKKKEPDHVFLSKQTKSTRETYFLSW